MKRLSDCALFRCFTEKCKGLFDYELRAKYDISAWIYPTEGSDAPECTHRWTGDARHSICRAATVACAAVLILGVMRALLRLMRGR